MKEGDCGDPKGPAEIFEEVMARVADQNMSMNHAPLDWRNFQHTLSLMLELTPHADQRYRHGLMRGYMMNLLTFGLRWVVANDARPEHPSAVEIKKRTEFYVQQQLLNMTDAEEEEES